MNRIRIILSIFIFLFLSHTLSFATFMKLSGAFAQEELTIKEATDSPELSKISKRVDYQLPYPGLLPDSPLYFLKAIRDRIVDFLISDPLKKADFYLLQADKRLNAGVYLFKIGKSKYNLAESTISKGENYFEQAIEKAKEAYQEGMEVNGITRKLINSAKKHQEELNFLEEKSAQSFKESFGVQRKRAEAFEKEVQRLLK